MPTIRRIWYPGAIYHITVRGNHKENIFREENDFEKYLQLIEETMEYYGYDKYEIICYCLMDNHVHIVIEAKNEPPGYFIGRVNSLYAKYFNKKYDCVGHLFQGRYHCKIIKNNLQMIEVSRYIHLNPVRANMVNKPQDYKWSSYNMYIGIEEEKIINPEKILLHFKWSIDEKSERNFYKEFVETTPGVKNLE